MTVSTPAFWGTSNMKGEGRFLLANMLAVRRGVTITRVFLLTDTDRADSNVESLIIESRIIPRQSKQREDCFQKAVIKRGLRRMRRSALRARSLSSP